MGEFTSEEDSIRGSALPSVGQTSEGRPEAHSVFPMTGVGFIEILNWPID